MKVPTVVVCRADYRLIMGSVDVGDVGRLGHVAGRVHAVRAAVAVGH